MPRPTLGPSDARSLPSSAVFLLLTAVLSFACGDEITDPLQGYYVSETDVALQVADAIQGPPFAVQVQRRFSGPDEERLLRIAEATYPPSEAIFEELAQDRVPRRDYPAPGPDLWWWHEFDAIRIPYAVTKSAVSYYVTLTEAFRRGAFDSLGTPPMLGSQLDYSAALKHHDRYTYQGHRFGDVYVATLSLRWSNYCGNLCALWLTKTRIVVLSSDGHLRGVFGDGISGYTVS